jgi:DNA polymerase-3 subunit epsilon
LLPELAGDASFQDLVIAMIDVETTGRDPSTDRVVEVGVALARGGEVVERFSWRVNPGCPIPKEASDVHHITDADVKDCPPFAAIAVELTERLSGAIPSAYNAAFDKAFLVSELGRAAGSTADLPPAFRREVDWLDPLVWAREIQAEERSRSLGEVAARLGVSLENAHSAEADADAALRVLLALLRDPRVPATYGAFLQRQRQLSNEQADERRLRWRAGS